MKNISLVCIICLLLFSCRSKNRGDFTIVKGLVTDEMGNPAAFANINISASKRDGSLFPSRFDDYEHAQFNILTDEMGQYEFAFFNSLDTKHYVGVLPDSLYDTCNASKELELSQINEDFDFSILRKYPLLRVNFIKQGEKSDYTVWVQKTDDRCSYIYEWETIQFTETETLQTHVVSAIPNDSLIFSIREYVISEDGEVRGTTTIQDTTFTTTDEISEVDFILY